MGKSAVILCQNCDQEIDRLGDACVWLDRPVCKPCFKRLSGMQSLRLRGFWMPVALTATAIAIVLAVLLAMSVMGNDDAAMANTKPSPTAPGQPASPRATPANLPANQGATATTKPTTLVVSPAETMTAGGLTKDEALAIFRSDRTWYSHWEQKDRKTPVKWSVTDDGGVHLSTQPERMGRIESRWVLLMDGHLFVVMNDKTLSGFFVRTSRPKGYFTDADSPND